MVGAGGERAGESTYWGPDFGELATADPEIAAVALAELERQRGGLQLIASENFTSPSVLAALGSTLSNKYAEGYPGRRYYGGCEYVDVAENLAIDRAKALFGAEHVNVQPHSGATANLAVYAAFAKPGDTVLAMSLPHGGHLTHGSRVSFSGQWFTTVPYHVDSATELIDYDEVRTLLWRTSRKSSSPARPRTPEPSTSQPSGRSRTRSVLSCGSMPPTSSDSWQAGRYRRVFRMPTWSPRRRTRSSEARAAE